jgi:hypothetical protein
MVQVSGDMGVGCAEVSIASLRHHASVTNAGRPRLCAGESLQRTGSKDVSRQKPGAVPWWEAAERLHRERKRPAKPVIARRLRRSNLLPDGRSSARQAGDCFVAARLAMTGAAGFAAQGENAPALLGIRGALVRIRGVGPVGGEGHGARPLVRRVVDIAQATCPIPRHPRESGDPGIMGSRFRGNDEEARKATAKSMT